jgi:hypothetical protein
MRTLLLVIAALTVAVDGYVHGLWTNRWENSPELEQALARLGRVPLTVGEWRGQELKLKAREVEQAGFAGYLLRRYQRHDGSAVTVLLACGRAGPLSVHTPETCYLGAGYTLSAQPAGHAPAADQLSRPAAFWKARFSKQERGVPVHTRVFWSWHARGAWQAPDSPRLTFAGLPAVHKLYLTCEMPGADERHADALCAEFLGLLLPELEKALFAPS